MKRAICKRRAVALDSIDHIINELRGAKKCINRAVIPKCGQRTLVSGDVSVAMSKLSEVRDNIKIMFDELFALRDVLWEDEAI